MNTVTVMLKSAGGNSGKMLGNCSRQYVVCELIVLRTAERTRMTAARKHPSVILPTEELTKEVLSVFLTPGVVPDDSELMECISPPRKFPCDRQGEQIPALASIVPSRICQGTCISRERFSVKPTQIQKLQRVCMDQWQLLYGKCSKRQCFQTW